MKNEVIKAQFLNEQTKKSAHSKTGPDSQTTTSVIKAHLVDPDEMEYENNILDQPVFNPIAAPSNVIADMYDEAGNLCDPVTGRAFVSDKLTKGARSKFELQQGKGRTKGAKNHIPRAIKKILQEEHAESAALRVVALMNQNDNLKVALEAARTVLLYSIGIPPKSMIDEGEEVKVQYKVTFKGQ